MQIISDKVWFNVSAVICVCGTNFCTLWGDTRRTINIGTDLVFENDTTEKVFKLNSRVVYGVTGLFKKDETVLTPVASIKNMETASLKDVKNAVLSYLETRKDGEMGLPANFVIGGKDSSGVFCVYEIHFNIETREVEVTARRPTIFKNFATSVLLPHKAAGFLDYYFEQLGNAVNTCRTHKELLQRVSRIAASIADLDDTVNRKITSVTVK